MLPQNTIDELILEQERPRKVSEDLRMDPALLEMPMRSFLDGERVYILERGSIFYLEGNCRIIVEGGGLECHGGVMMPGGGPYTFSIKKENPILPLFNMAEESLEEGRYPKRFSTKIRIFDTLEDILKPYNDLIHTPQQTLTYEDSTINEIMLFRRILAMGPRKMKIVAIIGERKTGKSTLSSFLVNSMLKESIKDQLKQHLSTLDTVDTSEDGNPPSGKQVYYLESDVGQSSICPPGFMAYSNITTPIFSNRSGWTGTYSKNTCLEFVGDFSPEYSPELFFSAFFRLLRKFWESHGQKEEGVLVVNTHGYLEEMGRHIMKDMLDLMKPDLLYCLSSKLTNLVASLKLKHKTRQISARQAVIKTGMLPFVNLGQLVPAVIKDRSRMVKLSRDISFVKFFGGLQAQEIEVGLENVDLVVFEEDSKIEVAISRDRSSIRRSMNGRGRGEDDNGVYMVKEERDLKEYSYEQLAVTLIGSICALEIQNFQKSGKIRIFSSFGLVTDFDLEKCTLMMKVPSTDVEYINSHDSGYKGDSKSPPKITIYKSPFLNINYTLLDSYNNYEEELVQHHQLGSKIFWNSGISIGVGGRPARKTVSVRKRLKV